MTPTHEKWESRLDGTKGAVQITEGIVTEDMLLSARHKELRDLLRRRMRFLRSLLGESRLKVHDPKTYYCYASKEGFAKHYPSDFDQQNYLEYLRSSERYESDVLESAVKLVQRALEI